MKKAVSLLLAVVLLALAVTATVNAEVVNPEPLKFAGDAVALAEESLGEPIPTNRVFFKMPAIDNWYSDYSVYQGKYYAGVYWWSSESINPASYPGYRLAIDDYEQGVYYADIPDDVSQVIWNNAFAATQAERDTPKDRQMSQSYDLNIEGAWEGDYDSLPEGSPDEESMNGCIFVLNPEPVIISIYNPVMPYAFDPYIYYGGGCYGSYAETSDNFVSVEENCLNPDHFDDDGNHIGGAHIKAPVAPADPPTDTEPFSAVNGYYFVSDREPDIIRSENKLYPSDADGEYYRYRYISQHTRFKIVHYMDGTAVSDCEQYPAEGWYNENGEINNYLTGKDYTVYFRPGGDGDSSYLNGTLKAVPYEELPTEFGWEQPIVPPTTAISDKPTEPPAPLPTDGDLPEPTVDQSLQPTVPCGDPDDPQPGTRYQSRFEEKYVDDYSDLLRYYEYYCHHDRSGEIDWVLVGAELNMVSPMPYNLIIGNRVLFHSCYANPFSSGYAVYDVKTDEFIDAVRAAKMYDGCAKAFDENIREGRLIGDLDKDNAISIIDATIIQRCEARMRGYPADDEIIPDDGEWGYSCKYYSDFDRDGERTILDATMLQRYLLNG